MTTTDMALRLVSIRRDLEYTQKEFADHLGVSIGAVQGYEYGKIPKGDILKKLCDWGYDVHWLLTGEGQMIRKEPKVDLKIAWNVAFYLIKKAKGSSDPKVFADTFVEVYEWMLAENVKPEAEKATPEATAEIINFVSRRLNTG